MYSGRSTQTPRLEKNHVLPCHHPLQMSVKNHEIGIKLILPWHQQPSLRDGDFLGLGALPDSNPKKTKKFKRRKGFGELPWQERRPSHRDPVWPSWERRGGTRGRHRAAGLETAEIFFLLKINFEPSDKKWIYLHIKFNHVCPMINGILHAGQGVLPYMGAMLPLKKIFSLIDLPIIWWSVLSVKKKTFSLNVLPNMKAMLLLKNIFGFSVSVLKIILLPQ